MQKKSTSRVRIATLIVVAAGLCHGPAMCRAQDGYIDREYPIKAMYLYNFAKYVRWPERPVHNASDGRKWFTIGIVGRSAIVGPLREIASQRQMQDRNVRLVSVQGAADLEHCQMVFVPSSEAKGFVATILPDTPAKPVLLVGESPGFATRGGMINFYTASNRVKFEINPTKAEAAKLKISSKLLRLGKIVP